jgi:hypothetical protein
MILRALFDGLALVGGGRHGRGFLPAFRSLLASTQHLALISSRHPTYRLPFSAFTSMAALAQCDAFAFIYDQAGDPAPDVLVTLKRVLDASGNSILLSPLTTLTDSAGSFHFTLPELATAFISARASALWNCPEGRAFTVPPGPSGELVPDFSLPASTLVEPPLVWVGDVLSIPKASATQDGYLSAADYVAFLAAAGAGVGISQINTGVGLTGGPITETGTISLATISGVAGTWSNPTSITVNAQGQIIAITSGAPDTTAPVITLVTSGSITGTSVVITWHTNEPADSQVEYGPTTAYGTSTPITDSTSPVLDHSVSISTLSASTLYHYRVKSRDTASNLQTSSDNTFTTTIVTDTTPPVISAVTATAITDVGATITWTTNEAGDSQVEYGPTTSYGTSTTLDATMVTSHSVPITLLTASTLYHFRVKSKDAAANLQTSPDANFTTGAHLPTLSDNLISYWKLDEAAGSPRADSITATGNNMIENGGSIASVAGKVGNAPSAPANAWLSHADNSTLDFTGKPLTIAGWLKIHSLAGMFAPMVSKWFAPSSQEFLLWYRADLAHFEFVVSADGTNTTGVAVDVAGPATIDQWYFVCAIYDRVNAEIKISVDDGTFATAAFPGPSIAHTAQDLAFIAGNAVLGDLAVDEIGIWDRALSTAEITQLAAGITYPSWT